MIPPERPEEVRLFLALDLPPAGRTELARWRDSVVSGRDELRPIPDEGLHVTLVFLGRRGRALVETVWETAAAAVAGLGAPTLASRGARWVPPRRARVLAVDLEDPEGRAAAVQRALSATLVEAGLHEAEARPFWPHVSVARVRGRAKVTDRALPQFPGSPFTASRVTLYRSDLHPSGARYVALERLDLAKSGI